MKAIIAIPGKQEQYQLGVLMSLLMEKPWREMEILLLRTMGQHLFPPVVQMYLLIVKR
ncbi:hypothetical protein D3C80_2051610 [compost metagenome]